MRVPGLQTVLLANAVFSTFSALLMLFFPALIAEFVIDLPRSVFLILGIGLALFAMDVFFAARKSSVSRGKAMYIFGADLAWVLLTPVMLIVLADKITRVGSFLLIDIALIVGVLAILEWIGISRLKNLRAEG